MQVTDACQSGLCISTKSDKSLFVSIMLFTQCTTILCMWYCYASVSRATRHTAVRHCSLLVYQSVNYALVGGATVITFSVSHYCFYARGFFVIVLNGEL